MHKIKPFLSLIGISIILPLTFQNCGRFKSSSLNDDHLHITMEQKNIVDEISKEHMQLNNPENFLGPDYNQNSKGMGVSHQKIGSPKVYLAPSKITADSISAMITNIDSVISQNRTYYYSEINFVNVGMDQTPATRWSIEEWERNRQPNDGG